MVIEVCRVLEIEDVQECLFKVLRMAQVLGADDKPSSKGAPPSG